nr:HtaA domain-containing protein [Streptomyces reniochalinae]
MRHTPVLLAAALTAASLTAPAAAAAGPGLSKAARETTPRAAPKTTDGKAVSGGRLDWGIKASFQSYVTGPIAQGSWSLSEGAATTGRSRFRFHSAQGGYDPASGTFDASFSGAVRFTGHREPGGGSQLDLTISGPAVRITAEGEATLYADIRSKARSTGKVTASTGVPLASLDLGNVSMRGGKSPLTLTDVPAKLSAQGASAFAGYYKAGTPLDPVTLSTDLVSRTDGKSRRDGRGSDGGTQERDDEKDARKTSVRFSDAAVDWGVRRTFREYVTGSLTKGRWKLSDGARDGGAVFRFPAGRGDFHREEGSLDAAFDGAVRFTGKHLNLTLDHVRVRVRDGKGTLSADVTRGEGSTKKNRELVGFAAGKAALKPKGGLVELTEAPAALTAQGADAFDGMYTKGTRMDPVSLAVALDEKARLPALPDLGSDVDAAHGSTGREEGKDRRTAETASSPTPAPTSLIAGGASAAALVAAGVVYLALRRRRARARPSTDG